MEDNTKLDLNADSVKDRTGVRSSLTDINQIFVFTNDFKNKKEQTDQEYLAEQKALKSRIFEMQFMNENNDVIGQLFQTTGQETIIRNEQTMAGASSFSSILGLAGILAVFTIGTMYLFGKKGKKGNDVNDQLKTSV